jgi:hypothetical protein
MGRRCSLSRATLAAGLLRGVGFGGYTNLASWIGYLNKRLVTPLLLFSPSGEFATIFSGRDSDGTATQEG